MALSSSYVCEVAMLMTSILCMIQFYNSVICRTLSCCDYVLEIKLCYVLTFVCEGPLSFRSNSV